MSEMEHLSKHIKRTLSMLDGYVSGSLVVEESTVSLLLEDDSEMRLEASDQIEVFTADGVYVAVSFDEIQNKKTVPEGWPLYAGVDARVKKRGNVA